MKLQAYKVKVDAVMPFTDFQPEINTIKFNVAIDHGSAGLSLQSSHTLNAFLNEADAQTAAVVQLNIDGSYEAYSTVDVARHIESCNLHIKMNSAKVKLFGTLIRYLLLLKDNYFGAWDHFSTIDEYRKQRKNHQEWLAQKKKQADAKVKWCYCPSCVYSNNTIAYFRSIRSIYAAGTRGWCIITS